MATNHTHHSGVTVSLHDGDDHVFGMTLAFTYTPGEPERGPSYASGGEPACPAEIEIDSIVLSPTPPDGLSGAILALCRKDEGLIDSLIETAEEDAAAERDEAAEYRAEMRREASR